MLIGRQQGHLPEIRARSEGRRVKGALCLLLFALCLPTFAQVARPAAVPDAALRDVGIDQRLNEQVPLDLVFRDETGRSVQLREYFGQRPVILALVYYDCPMLCHQVLNGLSSSLTALSFDAGKHFEVVAVSFDPREGPELAASRKQTYLQRYGRNRAAEGWHFLTGEQAAIESLTRAVGFRYTYDAETNQFAHASGIMLLTPEGKLSRYFYGIEFAPRDLRLGLIEASENKIGSPVDQILLFCYHYDPTTGQYTPAVMKLIRAGGAITLVGLLALIFLLRRRGSGRDAVKIGPCIGGSRMES